MQHIQHTGKEDQEDEVAKNDFAPHVCVARVSVLTSSKWALEVQGIEQMLPHREARYFSVTLRLQFRRD
jgi:hypothetical protein